MPSGGYRPNAGRKKKPVGEKLLEGKKGENFEVVDFGENAKELPSKPPDNLNDRAKAIYRKVYNWLKAMDCLKGILPYHLEEYAKCKDRWLMVEDMIESHGVLMKGSNDNPTQSPLINISMLYLKATNDIWNKIYVVVRESKITNWDGSNPNTDVMEEILRRKV